MDIADLKLKYGIPDDLPTSSPFPTPPNSRKRSWLEPEFTEEPSLQSSPTQTRVEPGELESQKEATVSTDQSGLKNDSNPDQNQPKNEKQSGLKSDANQDYRKSLISSLKSNNNEHLDDKKTNSPGPEILLNPDQNQPKNEKQSGLKSDFNPDQNQPKNEKQSGLKSDASIRPKIQNVTVLKRLKRAIIEQIYSHFKANRVALDTTWDDLGKSLGTTGETVRGQVKQLKFFINKETKKGPTGGVVLSLTPSVLAELAVNELEQPDNFNPDQNQPKNEKQSGLKAVLQSGLKGPSIIISSADDSKFERQNTNTKTPVPDLETPVFDAMPPEWRTIDTGEFETATSESIHPNILLGIYRAQKKPVTPGAIGFTATEVQDYIDQATQDFRELLWDKPSRNIMSVLVGSLMANKPYLRQSKKPFINRRARAAQERAQRLAEEARAIAEANESIFTSVFELWYAKQKPIELRSKKESYARFSDPAHLKLTVKEDFRVQNFEKIIFEGVEDSSKLSLVFDEIEAKDLTNDPKYNFEHWRRTYPDHRRWEIDKSLPEWAKGLKWELEAAKGALYDFFNTQVWPTHPNNPDSPKDPVDEVLFPDEPCKSVFEPVLGDLTGKSQEEITRLVHEHCEKQFGPVSDEQI